MHIMAIPISFSIPECKITNPLLNTCEKKYYLSPLIPNEPSTYIYNTEQSYYTQYKQSYFALTFKKAGWDCLRHYEIIANCCLPFFPNIENCPQNTMTHFPKNLCIQSNALYFKYNNKPLTSDFHNQHKELLNSFYNYVLTHLTTTAMAKYLISFIKPEPKSILFLSGHIGVDYLRCLTLHGLKTTYGAMCHDYPKIKHLYTDFDNSYELYGNGFSCSKLLNPNIHNDAYDTNIETLIKSNYFDIVIYGSLHRGLPFFELVQQCYSPNNVVFMCGEDLHPPCYADLVKNGCKIFVREL